MQIIYFIIQLFICFLLSGFGLESSLYKVKQSFLTKTNLVKNVNSKNQTGSKTKNVLSKNHHVLQNVQNNKFTPSNDAFLPSASEKFSSNVTQFTNQKVDNKPNANILKPGLILVNGKIYGNPKININTAYCGPQKTLLTPLPKSNKVKNANAKLVKKSLPKKDISHAKLSVKHYKEEKNKETIIESPKAKVSVLQGFLNIFSWKSHPASGATLHSKKLNTSKVVAHAADSKKVSVSTSEKVRNSVNDNNLIFRYGIFDDMQPDIIHNPKYLKVKHSPVQLKSEAERIRELSLNKKYLKERLDKRVDELSKNLLDLHSQYPLLTQEQLRNLYNVRSIKEFGNVNLALNNLQLIDSIVSSVPVLAPSNVKITSHFGPRKLHKSPLRMHAGIDLVHDNRSIYASASGVVEIAAKDKLYGNFVLIKHENCKTKYGHLEKWCVRPGQLVEQGDLIGIEGATGRVTGRHLHLEVLINQTPVNPIDFLKYSLGNDYKNQVAYKKKCSMEASLSKSQLISVGMRIPTKSIPIKRKQIQLKKPANKKQKLL
jgi:murein DD-endopeptidase MepM/ murein hydrolase activator NlpD